MVVGKMDSFSAQLDDALSRFTKRNAASQALYDESVKSLPGGNTRTVLHTKPFPVYMKSGSGYQVTSEDLHTYTDLTGEFSAGLYGHSHPGLKAAISAVLQDVGLNLGATTRQEARFAKALCQRFDLERVRFANSGTEATLHALAAARAYTGKRRVAAFHGAYHGGVFGFAGGKPAANNVDQGDFVMVQYNDLEGAKKAIRGEGIAAVIVEGMQGAGGCICGTREFLAGVQKAASDAGVVFILDEVMTSRIASQGLAVSLGLKPDLKTLGKYLGGGLAFGALGGREDIMAAFDPRVNGSLSHSGTFNNNTLAMHAGHEGITNIYTPEVATALTATGEQLRAALNEATLGTRMFFTGVGSLMAVHITTDGRRDDVLCGADFVEVHALKDLLWFEMLEEGFWMARRGFVALVLGTPQAELDRFVEAMKRFVAKYQDHLKL